MTSQIDVSGPMYHSNDDTTPSVFIHHNNVSLFKSAKDETHVPAVSSGFLRVTFL